MYVVPEYLSDSLLISTDSYDAEVLSIITNGIYFMGGDKDDWRRQGRFKRSLGHRESKILEDPIDNEVDPDNPFTSIHEAKLWEWLVHELDGYIPSRGKVRRDVIDKIASLVRKCCTTDGCSSEDFFCLF